ncbi:2,3-bisphosphoglycerate-dependent phosphoglycerate mutase [Deinococcus sp. HSC-46F16]|uniref:histidine phosphatase family protein n=1 Tax=Deinococcus sp. HSC-46F16 TaxID=2910968 RepID=UPI00209F6351|nr:histidine phosphatase family protein [Deinococcus sp. HSC-46F16]MCP2013393.1 2,3-bisphosphoglycerate-dependent phosphoglycerate mutase [Deinococcus sp. HSC-46F16]
MTGELLLIRHAKATGQAPDAALTPAGEAGARRLAVTLANAGITCIVSSPWRRAVDTARPLAARLGLAVETDGRLTERVLSGADLPGWMTHLEASFADPDLALPGGESGRVAHARILAALEDARDPGGVTAVFTHGNLLALALGLDHAGWAGLRNPDVWRLDGEGRAVRVST